MVGFESEPMARGVPETSVSSRFVPVFFSEALSGPVSPADHQLITVVIPTYNRRDLVIEAIQSVLNQRQDTIEIIVVDDGSTDETVDHLAALDLPVRIIRLPHTGVIARARNAGIEHARGAFISFLDSDDLWLPDKLRLQLDYLLAHPEASVLYANQYRQEKGRILDQTRFDRFPPRSRAFYRDSFDGLFIQTSSVIVRREVFQTVGLFDEGLLLYEDADMWSRLSEQYELAFIEKPLVVYRPDIDPQHLQHDRALLVQEARKYLERYFARRARRQATDEENEGTDRFVRALMRLEAEVMSREGRG